MGLEFFAAIAPAFCLGGFAAAARMLSGGRLPKWLVPAAAGFGILGYALWSEQDWFNRVSSGLPPTLAILEPEAKASPFKPWTYFFPVVSRFQAIDSAQTATHPQNAELRLLRVFTFERWFPVRETLVVAHCAEDRVITIREAIEIGEDGTLKGAEWQTPDAEGRAQLSVACIK